MPASAVTIVSGLTVLCGGVAAGLWFWSALIKVPTSLDTLHAGLKRIAFFNACAAAFASAGAIGAVVLFLTDK